MYILKPRRKLEIGQGNKSVKLSATKAYIIPDSFWDAMQQSDPNCGSVLDVLPFNNKKDIVEKTDFTGKKLLISRTGGRGDLFFILRTIKEIKDNYEDVHITFCCGEGFKDTLTMFPHLVDEILTIPFDKKVYDNCDYFITFENYIELNPIAKKINAYDLIARKFFVELTGHHGLDLEVPVVDRIPADSITSKWEKPVIGIQPRASALLRTYPTSLLAALIRKLKSDGYDILILDTKKGVEELQAHPVLQGVDLLTPYEEGTDGSFTLSVALASFCKLIICPDSVFTYVGDSLGVPVLALYGAFSSELRAHKLNVHAIDVLDGCYNCNEHSPHPCSRSVDGWSPCMKAIGPEVIYHLVLTILKGEDFNADTEKEASQG